MIVPGLAQPQSSNESPPLPTRGRRRASPAALRRLASSWIAFRLRDLRRRQFAAKAAPLLAVAGLLLALPGLTLLPGPLSFAHGLLIGAVGALLAAVHLGAVADAAATPAPVGDVRFTELCDQLERRIETLQDAHWEISESDVRYRDLLDAQSDVILRRDAEGRLTFVNAAFVGAFGVSAADALGKPFSRVIVEASRTKPLTTADVERSRRYVEQIETASGPRWFEWEEQLVAASDGGLEVQAVGRDITAERRRSDELEEARDAALSANRAKSRFLAAMSHEIRTPMNGILGMTELALETNLTAEQREYLHLVKDSGEALMVLLNDILDFSKIEAGKLELEPITFHLRETLGDVLAPLGLRAHQKGLELVCHILPEAPDVLIGDPGRLRQIIVNLVGNAIKFTEEGEIVITVKAEHGTPHDQRLHFTVTDTGIGIPADKHHLIFEAFTQGDSTTTRQFGGTGLGLAICKQLVEMMGGHIWVESEAGQGSAFHFIARFGIPENIQAMPFTPPPELIGQAILIIDDNATSRGILSETLAGWGLKPAAVASSQAALNLSRQQSFDLALVDAALADSDGFRLAFHLKENGVEAIVMMLSRVRLHADAARCREMGIRTYLTKPVKLTDLAEALLTASRHLAGHTNKHRQTGSFLLKEFNGLHILIAEDNVINQRLATRLLEKCGHTVTVVGNGRAAIAAFQEHIFDLILMDIQMPDMSGFAAITAIRELEQEKGTRTPVIAVTAYAMKGDRERCLAAGVDAYLSKPLHVRELMEVIARLTSPMELTS